MKIWPFFVFMLWIFTMAGIGGGEEKGKMDQEIFQSPEAEGWKWDEKEIKYNSRTLFEYIDGAAELYLAYGFQNLTVRRFEKSDQPPITIELYEMASSEDAYGVFSFEHQDEAVGIGQGSEFGGGLLRFWKGKYFVSIYGEGGGRRLSRQSSRWGGMRQGQFPQLVLSRNWLNLFQERSSGWSIRASAILRVTFS
jgi:hypothetical protein